MLKLYKFTEDKKEYWETWDNGDGTHTVHWGILGQTGQSKTVKKKLFKKPQEIIQAEVNSMVDSGYLPVKDEFTLIVEFSVDGSFGNDADIEKRHRLEDRLNHILGWTGLGHCDGGSIGSGTMEACNFVVDFDIAKKVIEDDLKGTEFENYTRIYDENAE
jgi:hypothetical protein